MLTADMKVAGRAVSRVVIRFFPDGGAQALHRLVLKCDKLAKTWDFSFLNGRMIAIDGDGSDEDMNNNREE